MNWPLYRSMHGRQLTQTRLAALTGMNRSVLARILTNEAGRGRKTRAKLFPHLTPEEIGLLGWGDEFGRWQLEQCATGNIVPGIPQMNP